ncbi:IQ calmodulin binding motif-containing protein [Phytophthora infestans]|uniref:IQ calmodulin binding motif-containing protein n=1 Tax=Phytophthora infestans TaxID=4787 RepID=A0A833T9U2_PHYIN|nr:IQ calmodulin binding motif-containing protein [Phytophthora infestans]
MREQVIEEKLRQVTLFQRLETARCSHTRQLNDAEAALRASQADGERLQARLAQARVSAAHEARRTAALAQSSKAERQRLVCALAETRHKFREWKEGEAATLRATREQAVHALRTEYELKLARHQEEKQKLRDKVKDLEVSLRLLQRDRQLSPDQLSERKGTLLQFTPGGVGFGDVGAADFIEAQGRIQELEGLLQLSKERQERQDELLRVSETALTRLNQERELDALENLSLPSPAVALALTNLTGVTPVEETDKPSGPAGLTPMPATPATASVSPDVAPLTEVRKMERLGSMVALSAPPSTPNGSPGRRQSSTGGTDIEKEVLRRNSIVLSAEVNRYQKIVVQSMEEVRALKEFRRQTRSGSADNSAIVLTAREAYLLEELAASQREIDTMKAKLRKMRKKWKSKAKSSGDGELLGQIDSDSTCSSCRSHEKDSDSSSDSDVDCENENDSTSECDRPLVGSVSQPRMSLIKEHGDEKELLETDAAVMMIQSFSKGFLARRQFIRKKLAIGKIKARYRGYLVRKNYEALGSSMITTDRQLLPSGLAPEAAHDYLLVTEAMQYKMQIVEPHHEEPYICEGGGQSTSDMVDVVLRVSKDPPILQLQTTPSTPSNQETAVARVAYFHLFETIALLPYEDEEVVLETSSEKEIARIFAARLVVQCKGSDNRDYHFFITRTSKKEQESAANGKEDLVLGRRPRTLLTELPVQPMETRATSASSDTFEPPLDGAESVFVHEVDLDLLIREARTDPLKEDSASTRCVTGEDEVSEHGTARVQRLVRRLSSTSYGLEEQQHRSDLYHNEQ